MKEKEFNTLQAYVTILGGDREILQEKTQDTTVKNHPLVVFRQFSVEVVQRASLWSWTPDETQELVENAGVDPATSRMLSKRSTI